jgi:hypothetical protein
MLEQDLAEIHLREATILLEATLASGAIYLPGIAVELATFQRRTIISS